MKNQNFLLSKKKLNNIVNIQNKTNINENKSQKQKSNASNFNKLMIVTLNPNQQNNIQKEKNEIHQEQHPKKFGFIKKGNKNKNEEFKKETSNINKKVNIQILYKEKLMKYNSNMFDWNQIFINFVRKISLINRKNKKKH